MTSTLDISKLDLYGILNVSEDATEKQIVKSYRKQALKCHPDKNPDNPAAAELFHQLSKALEVLTDAAARAAYDKIQKAKKAAALRHKQLDAKRKKFKEDLEARESNVQDEKVREQVAAQNLQAEIERLRKEGSRLLEQEQEYLRQHLKEDLNVESDEEEEDEDKQITPKLRVRWKAAKGDDSNGGYSSEILENILSKYGEVLNLLVSVKKKGSAIVEFASPYAAELAVQSEHGLPENPLTLTWLQGQPPKDRLSQPVMKSDAAAATEPSFPHDSVSSGISSVPSTQGRDYESLILMKMRQAEERKRLIEQMQKEDEEA